MDDLTVTKILVEFFPHKLMAVADIIILEYFRLLDINATRRGVKTCPLCTNKIGNRAKQCKYCSPGKQKRRSRKSQTSKEPNNDSEQSSSNVDMNMVLIDSEPDMPTSPIGNTAEVSVSSTSDVISKNVTEDVEAVTADNFVQGTQSSVNAIEGMEAETSQQNSGVIEAGKKTYHTSLQELIQTLLVQNQSSSLYVAQDSEEQADKVDTENSDVNQQEEQAGDVEVKEVKGNSVGAVGAVGSPENAYDANSVALFLGHLAQQNGKKARPSLNIASDNAEPNTSTSSPLGIKAKQVVIEDDLSSQAKYRKIRPKTIDECTITVEIQRSEDCAVEEEIANTVGEVKSAESQLR